MHEPSRMSSLRLLLLALLLPAVQAAAAWADEEGRPDDTPPAEAPESPAAARESTEAQAGAGTPAGVPDDTPSLAPVEIVAPRAYAGPGSIAPARSFTAERLDAAPFDLPDAVTIVDGADINQRRLSRSMPDALLHLPGVLVQKTGPLQASPFIRGFTGYNNLMMIDGVRLNHSAFRAGPNQYWSTIDPYTIDSLEVVRGPHSVLYGSDAVGGTVNALTRRRMSFARGWHQGGGLRIRGATAENALAGRVEVQGNYNNFGWLGGVTLRQYGDIDSGGGLLPYTGGIEEGDGDVRFDWLLNRDLSFVFVAQYVNQNNAPRTERTIHSVPFRGTSVGSELQRDLDQRRTLVYGRLLYEPGSHRGWIQNGAFTVSYHGHDEERDRLRTMDRRDLSGFGVDQFGVTLALESCSSIGTLTYGFDYYHDEVSSYRQDYVAGVPTLTHIQGPVGDDASYDLFGAYIQDHWHRGRWHVYAGARFTYAAAQADRVDNPAVAGNDPTTPGNIISVSNDWSNVVGSLKALYEVSRRWHVYAGASQAFRAPSLSDLTALDSTSVVESPSPDLDAENYLSFELGAKTQSKTLTADAALWYTVLDDTIVRSPTGVLIMGVPEVRKDNIGSGWAWGFEVDAAWQPGRAWTLFGNLSWMDAEVDELDAATGSLVSSPLSRMKPLTALAAARYEAPWNCWWAQAEYAWSNHEDRLSLRDATDTRRIPPGGTPGYTVINLRAGLRMGRSTNLTMALENILDENYRIHGSGQNEPGRSLVVGLSIDW